VRPAPSARDLDEAFWQACHGGQLRAAERLMAAGADINAVPDYGNAQSALDMALSPDTRRDQLATWLREHGATQAEQA